MKSTILISIFYFCFISCFAQQPTIQWQKTYGGSFYDKAVSVVETEDGGYFIGGHSQSDNYDLTTHIGFFDGWVVKLNKAGELQWKKSLGGSGEDYINSVVQTKDGKYICAGYTNSTNYDIAQNYGHVDYWLIKFTSSGTIEWKKTLGGNSNEFAYSICLAGDDKYLIAGYSESTNVPNIVNHGMMDAWIIEINGAGDILWQKTYGGLKNDHAHNIIKTKDGGFAFTGYTDSVDLPGIPNKGGLDFWILKMSSTGDIQWQNTFGGSLDEFSRCIIECNDGSFVIAGETYSHDYDATENHRDENNPDNRDYFIVKVNNLGQKIWSRCYGGVKNEYARSIVQNFAGEYVVVGESYSGIGDGYPVGNHGSADFWLLKLNPINGDILWQKSYGGNGHDEPNCLLNTFDNGYLMIGNTASNNGDISGWRGDDDFWIVKLKNNECETNLTLTKNIPSGNYDYSAAEQIIFNGKILDNTSIIKLKANKGIVLTSGFQTQTGALFEATMGGCDN